MIINRNITNQLLMALQDTPAVFLTGARQTGKSTLAKDLLQKNIFDNYVTLDNLNILSAARNDPIAFIAGYKDQRLIIDEIQRVPDLILVIKESIDSDRKPGKFLLTGSANIMLLPKIAESLAGRMEIINLWPFAQQELFGHSGSIIDQFFAVNLASNNTTVTNMWETIITGGYPEVLTRTSLKRKEQWFESYLDSLLQRDIREIANIEDLTLLPRLLTLIATRTTTLVNYAEFARSSTIPQTSIKRYISLFENIFIVYKVSPWAKNISKRLVKSPKLLISDLGLASYLLSINQDLLQKNDQLRGQLFENFITLELLKQLTWSNTSASLFHYRTQNQKEIDIILEDRSGKIVAIEIKSRSTVTSKDFASMVELAEELNKDFIAGYVIYTGDLVIPFAKNMFAVPAQYLF